MSLRLAKLEDLENQQALARGNGMIRTGNGSLPTVRIPYTHFHVAQLKSKLDEARPLLDKFVHRYIYLPLFRYFHKRWRFVTPTQQNADGSYSWVEHQGCFLTEAEAEADRARYPKAYIVKDLPLGRSLPSETVQSKIHFKGEAGEIDVRPLIEEVDQIRAHLARARTAL